MSRFIQSDPNQALLLPIDLREWVPEDDLCHFVLEAVSHVSVSRFKVNSRGSGSAQYHPHMMLALLIYCYANGTFGSRRIERATYRDVGVRYLCANRHPDHDTICKFRRENFEAFSEAFLQVLLMAKELRLLKVGRISVDGTKLDANANKHRSVRYDRAGALVEQLEADIAELLEQAEGADQQGGDDEGRLPEELARREHLRDELNKARARLEADAKTRAERERVDYERKCEQRDKRSGKRRGKKPKPPSDEPEGHEQSNLSDPDSRLMRKNKHAEYRQGYNGQAAVDADGSQLILSNHITQNASDSNELVAAVDGIPAAVGRPTGVLADTGYANGRLVDDLERRSVEVLMAVGRSAPRCYDFRPPKAPITSAATTAPWRKRMQARMLSERGRRLYRLRKQTVEPVFGIIKEVMGFRRFHLRGLEKVRGEWGLVCLAYNIKRLHRLIQVA
jgi:transposase